MPSDIAPRPPCLFVSHGPPTLVLDRDDPTHVFLTGLGPRLARPKAILCVTAHWETPAPQLSSASNPETIHDFFGFPRPLYDLGYPAPGAPALAREAVDLLNAEGIEAELDPDRGLDHGTWSPLILIYPAADIPLFQLSVQANRDARHHYAVGRSLRPLRDQGVLIVASGNATHNLADWHGHAKYDPAAAYARAFDDWLAEAVEDDRREDLLDWTDSGPEALHNHPSPEHFLPLFVALGAAGSEASGKRLHAAFLHGVLSMAAFEWP